MFDESLIKDGGKDAAYKLAEAFDAVAVTSETESSKLLHRDESPNTSCDEDDRFEGRKPSRKPARHMSLSLCRTVETDEWSQGKSHVSERRRIEEVSTEAIQQTRAVSLHLGTTCVKEMFSSGADDCLDGILNNKILSDDDGNGSSDDSFRGSVIINDEHISSNGSVSIDTDDGEDAYLETAGSSSFDDGSIIADHTNSVKLKRAGSSGEYMEVYSEDSSYHVRPNTFHFERQHFYSFTAHTKDFIKDTKNEPGEICLFSIQLDDRSYFLHPWLSDDPDVLELRLSAVSRDILMTESCITRPGESFSFLLHRTPTDDIALESFLYRDRYISFDSGGVVVRKMRPVMESAFINMFPAVQERNTILNIFG